MEEVEWLYVCHLSKEIIKIPISYDCAILLNEPSFETIFVRKPCLFSLQKYLKLIFFSRNEEMFHRALFKKNEVVNFQGMLI